MRFISLLNKIYWRFFKTPEEYARKIGVSIGDSCLIETRNWSSEPYLVHIGNNVQITKGVSIHTHGGCNALRNIVPDLDIFGKVIIKDWAYIGSYSHIMPGVIIGENAIVGAGSIVTKSVESNTIVAGNPAKCIGTIDEFLVKNKKYNCHTYGLSKRKKKQILMNMDEFMFINK